MILAVAGRPGGRGRRWAHAASRRIPALSFAILGWLGPGLAERADAIASAANSTVPAHVLLVGASLGQPDTTTGAFTIVVRDGNAVPIPFQDVEFRVLLCPGARVATDQMQPGVTARCATLGILARTDLDGIVRIAAVGGGEYTGLHGTGPCARVYSSGVWLGDVSVAYPDLDGSNGLGAQDLSHWLTDFGTGDPIGRSDFNGDGQLTADDLSLWLQIWADGRQVESPAAYCP